MRLVGVLLVSSSSSSNSTTSTSTRLRPHHGDVIHGETHLWAEGRTLCVEEETPHAAHGVEDAATVR